MRLVLIGILLFLTANPALAQGGFGGHGYGWATNRSGGGGGGLTSPVGISDGGTGQTSQTAAFDALSPNTTGGDITYHNGTNNVRLPKGTALQMFRINAGGTAPEWFTLTTMTNPMTTTGDTIYSSSGSTPARLAVGKYDQQYSPSLSGVPAWSDRQMAPSVTTDNLRFTWGAVNVGGVYANLGSGSASNQGTATNGADSTGSWVNYASAATANSIAGVEWGGGVIQRQTSPRIWMKIKTGGDLLVQRTWVGLSSSFGTARANDNPSSVNVVACRASTSASDTTWQFATCNASSSTITDTGVAISANTVYTFCFDCTSGSSIDCYINGVKVATNSTNLPAGSSNLYPFMETVTLENVAKNIKAGSLIVNTL